MSSPLITRVADALFAAHERRMGNVPARTLSSLMEQSQAVYIDDALAALEALSEGLKFADPHYGKSNLCLNGQPIEGFVLILSFSSSALFYADIAGKMGAPYKTEAEAKTALMNHARLVLFGLGPKEG